MNDGFLRVLRRVVAYWRMIVVLLIFALATAIVLQGQFVSFELLLLTLLLIFIASQIFWIGRIVDLGKWLFPDQPRVRLVVIADLVYLFVIAYSFPTTIGQGHTFRAAYYGLSNIVFEAVFWWWFVGSMLAFALVVAFGTVERATRVAAWPYRKARQSTKGCVAAASSSVADPVSPGRRHFLEQTAVLISATPFVAAGYGLLHSRLDVEVVRPRIPLARLPKAFDGFRIAQLSDIHILRQARAPIVLGGETLNLIGIDEPHGRTETEWRRDVHRKLRQIKELMMPETVNILLSHGDFPHMFDRVAELGIDLMLAGHTHGGQLSLDFVHRGLNLSHLIYDYNSGWYEKNGAQLYVNRGIGTTGFPIRLGARPEISVFELSRT